MTAETPPPTWKPYTKRHHWRFWPWLFLIVPAVVASVAVMVLASRLLIGNAEPPLEATQQFLAAVADGDSEAAFAMLCPEAQGTLGPDDFSRRVAVDVDEFRARLSTAASPTSSRITVLGDLTIVADGEVVTRPIFFELVEAEEPMVAASAADGTTAGLDGAEPDDTGLDEAGPQWLVCLWRIDGERFGPLDPNPNA